MIGCSHQDGRHRHGWNRGDQPEDSRPPSPSRLYRNVDHAMLKGVCAGAADYLGIQAWIIRVAALVFLFAFPLPAIIAYIVLVKVVPPRPKDLYETPAEEKFWAEVRTRPERSLSALRHRVRELELRLRRLESWVTSREFRLRREIDGLEG